MAGISNLIERLIRKKDYKIVMTIKEDSGKLLATLYIWKQEGHDMLNSENEL
jgi:hypothetical protein